MFQDEKVIALIPARGGSKRLVDKNLRILDGKSLIEWSILAGKGSKFVDEIVVSTDSQRVVSVAEKCRVDDVIHRPPELAGDETTTTEVIEHAISHIYRTDEQSGYIVLLQPTSPLRHAGHIDQAFELMVKKTAIGAIGVCKTEHPVEWMGKISENLLMNSFFEGAELQKRSQDFSPSYQVNGAIYIVPINCFVEEKTIFLKSGMVAYVMDRRESVDIDDEYDLALAEWFLRQSKDE